MRISDWSSDVCSSEFLTLELLEEGKHPLAADARGLEELGAGGIGGRFLDAREGEELAHRRGLPRRKDARARIARTRRHRGDAEHQTEQRDAHRRLEIGSAHV